jgi:hypothetical protein
MLEKRVQTKLGVSEELPEGIFGLLDSIPKAFKTEAKTKVKTKNLKSIKTSRPVASKSKIQKLKQPIKPKIKTKLKRTEQKVMPDFVINYDKSLPQEADGIKLDNVVSIPEELLKDITAKTQLTAKQLSTLMLKYSATSVLSFDAASSYVRTVLDDGLGIAVDVDRGVLEVVKDLSRLDVIFFFVKRLAMPLAFKKKFMHILTEESAKLALTNMQKVNKSEQMSQQLRELEGVLVKRSENKARTVRKGDGQLDQESKIKSFLEQKAGFPATRRSRGDNSPSNPFTGT